MKKFDQKMLPVFAFVTGFSLLVFELAAARILAPTIGSSTYVYTSVIGIIIAALSLGYWVGGMVADRRGRLLDIVYLLLGTSVAISFALVMYLDVLASLAESDLDVRLQAVVASLVLFAPASFLLGMISPYLVKLNVRSLSSSGRQVASLSALNSIGGIVGTFLTGFVLFGYIGSRQTIAIVAVLLLIMSWLVLQKSRTAVRVVITIVVLLLVGIGLDDRTPSGRVSIDTASAHYEVVDFFYEDTPARGLITGPGGIQSAVALSGAKDPLFWYTQELARITLEKKPTSVLVLGGGTFTLPEYLAQELPDATIDVVEIDPKLEGIAKQYFQYESPSNVNLIFSDARTYINQADTKYDVIIADAYGDSSIPFSLITKEYGVSVAAHLHPNGIVLANIIGGLRGPCRDVFDVASAAYTQNLSHSSYALNPVSSEKRGNIIGLYSNATERYGLTPIQSSASAFTDNYSPSERLYFACEAVTI